MLKKFTKKALSFFIVVMLMVAMFTTTAEAAGKPGGGGGGGGKPSKNTAPTITLVGVIPTLTEDEITTGTITLSATDLEGNSFTWSIVSTSFGNATLEGTINPTANGTINVNYTAPVNKNGTAIVTVQAKDTSGAAKQFPISIKVIPVNDMPENITLPSITGNVASGQTVSAAEGTWSDIETPAASLAFAYQWQLADALNGTNIANIATSKAYAINISYSSKYIRVGVKATDTGDNGTAPITTDYVYSPWILIGQQQVQEAQYYVALGDSIAAGTNNQNLLGNSYRYTNTFSSSLAAIFTGTSYGYKNDATPGDTTDDLLSKLKSNSTIRSDVTKATIITISIGGNNVLSSASPKGYSKINDVAASTGIANFEADLPTIVALINSLHAAGHLPQIYIMDMYNLFHPWERGWVVYSDGHEEEGFMNQIIYENYLKRMQNAINTVASTNNNVYRVKTYEAFESNTSRYTITNTSHLKRNAAFISDTNQYGSYFYSPYIEGTAVYNDIFTRFDIYPFYPILFDYANLDKYRDPHPDQAGHNVLSAVHLSTFKTVNGLN